MHLPKSKGSLRSADPPKSAPQLARPSPRTPQGGEVLELQSLTKRQRLDRPIDLVFRRTRSVRHPAGCGAALDKLLKPRRTGTQFVGRTN